VVYIHNRCSRYLLYYAFIQVYTICIYNTCYNIILYTLIYIKHNIHIGSVRAVLMSLIALNRFSFNLENLLCGILRTRVRVLKENSDRLCAVSMREDSLCISFMRRVCLWQTQTSVCPSWCEFSGPPKLRWKSLKPLFVWLTPLASDSCCCYIKVNGLSNIHYYALIETHTLFTWR